MRNCWQHSPDDRPTFAKVVARLGILLEGRTTEVMFNIMSLYYIPCDTDALENGVPSATHFYKPNSSYAPPCL